MRIRELFISYPTMVNFSIKQAETVDIETTLAEHCCRYWSVFRSRRAEVAELCSAVFIVFPGGTELWCYQKVSANAVLP